MRRALFASLAVLVLSFPARQAFSSPYRQANDYFQVRDVALAQDQLLETFASDEVQTQPQKFDHKLIEVRGIISAIAGSESQTTLLIEGAPGNPPIQVLLPAGKKVASWPFLDVGISFRALCKVVTLAGSSSGSLELVIPVKEYEAVAVDGERKKLEEARKRDEAIRRAAEQRQQGDIRSLASRSMTPGMVRSAPVGSQSDVLNAYARAVRYFNRRVTTSEAQTIARIIINYSQKYGLDARLVMAVIACESNFNQHAVSPVGAQGLGQLMPGTAAGLGVNNSFDIDQNLEGSTRLLAGHINSMSRSGERSMEEAVKLALACYNAGAGAVRKFKGIPPYRETRNYVKKITRLYKQFCGEPV